MCVLGFLALCSMQPAPVEACGAEASLLHCHLLLPSTSVCLSTWLDPHVLPSPVVMLTWVCTGM